MTDAEALVINIDDPSCPSLRLYAWISSLSFALEFTNVFNRPNGKTVKATSHKRNTIRIGDIVTFSYDRGSPGGTILAKILRVRKDLSWKEVMRNWHQQHSSMKGAMQEI